MRKDYAFVGEFNNGYAYVRSYSSTNNKGLIDSNGNEVIPTDYFEIIGSVYGDFFIGVRNIMEERYPIVDWDNDSTTPYYVCVGKAFYMLDKEGHKFKLDVDSRCQVNYEGLYGDRGSCFTFKYQKNSCLDYYDIFNRYTFYANEDFILIKSSDGNYIQYFDGERKEISYDELNCYIEQLKQLKLQRSKKCCI